MRSLRVDAGPRPWLAAFAKRASGAGVSEWARAGLDDGLVDEHAARGMNEAVLEWVFGGAERGRLYSYPYEAWRRELPSSKFFMHYDYGVLSLALVAK